MFRLLLLVAVCSATERLSVSFRVDPVKNLQSLPFEVVLPGYNESYRGVASKRNSADNVVNGYITLPINGRFNHLTINLMEDQFLQKSLLIYVKRKDTTHLKMTTDDYKLYVTTSIGNYSKVGTKNGPLSCGCEKNKCSCCSHVRVMKFDHELCTNISYNAETIGIVVSICLDNYCYNWQLSARNPPPICFDIPGSREIASVCLAFKDLDLTREHFKGCLEAELEVIHMRTAHVPLGCFDMPI